MRRLRYLPWRSLLQVSGQTIVIVILLEVVLTVGYTQSFAIRRTLSLLYAPPLGLVITLMAAVGVGVLAVYLLQRFYPQVLINSATLWALIPCLALVIFLKSLLPLPGFLATLTTAQLVGIIVGVFWKGRPYWR
ncbi:MAG: peptide chain release factor 1 [Coleofasciculus sp. S288]|nr:peptide chain release factor 1 [Coleofasciculus sp. S288]